MRAACAHHFAVDPHVDADLPTGSVDVSSTSCAHRARAHTLERAVRFQWPRSFQILAPRRSGYSQAAHLVRESAARTAGNPGPPSLRRPPASKQRHSKGAGRRTRTLAWSCGDRSPGDHWEEGGEWPWTMSHAAAASPPGERAHAAGWSAATEPVHGSDKSCCQQPRSCEKNLHRSLQWSKGTATGGGPRAPR